MRHLDKFFVLEFGSRVNTTLELPHAFVRIVDKGLVVGAEAIVLMAIVDGSTILAFGSRSTTRHLDTCNIAAQLTIQVASAVMLVVAERLSYLNNRNSLPVNKAIWVVVVRACRAVLVSSWALAILLGLFSGLLLGLFLGLLLGLFSSLLLGLFLGLLLGVSSSCAVSSVDSGGYLCPLALGGSRTFAGSLAVKHTLHFACKRPGFLVRGIGGTVCRKHVLVVPLDLALTLVLGLLGSSDGGSEGLLRLLSSTLGPGLGGDGGGVRGLGSDICAGRVEGLTLALGQGAECPGAELDLRAAGFGDFGDGVRKMLVGLGLGLGGFLDAVLALSGHESPLGSESMIFWQESTLVWTCLRVSSTSLRQSLSLLPAAVMSLTVWWASARSSSRA